MKGSCFAERLSAFSEALVRPEKPVPRGLVGPDGQAAERRFNVYRNNVVAGLTSALRSAFPAVSRIVGDEFFAAMARAYVSLELPSSAILLAYGAGFPRFVSEFCPARGLGYLGDVARVERAWAEAYHAAEAEPLGPADFGPITVNQLMRMRVVLHPSLRLVRSTFPVLTLWQTNIEGGTPTGVDLDAGGQDVLIVRPAAEVEVRALPRGGAGFVQALARGLRACDAMQAALADDRRFDLAANWVGLLAAGAFVAFDVEDGSANTTGVR